MEYADKVYVYLLKLRPGEKVNISTSKDPKRLIDCVKDLMDNWYLRRYFSFNADYTVLRRMFDFETDNNNLNNQ